jgi:hypothetical protein
MGPHPRGRIRRAPATADRSRRSSAAPVRRLLGIAVATAALAASGCFYGPDQSLTYLELYANAKAENLSPWFCQATGVGGSMSHGHGAADGLANDFYAGKAKGELTDEQCRGVADFFDKARAVADQFPTRGIAKQHLNRRGQPGFIQSVQFVPGLGTHDLLADVSQSGFDPQHPMFFQYDGNGDDARLAGLSWFVQQPEGVTTPPEGFPGDNDWWHTHATLCYAQDRGGVVVGNEISDEECARRGGKNEGLPRVWMAHAWILPGYENTRDVFSGAYMCVKGTGPVAAEDPCHDDRTDPEHDGTAPRPTVPPELLNPGTGTGTSTSTSTAPGMSEHGDHGH